VETLLHLLPRQLHQIKENKWNKPFACGMRAACVCRFFASLCRQEGDAERLHVFCYDLLREFTPFTVKELLSLEAIALAWPQAIRRQVISFLVFVYILVDDVFYLTYLAMSNNNCLPFTFL
jgi:hypothetical protein